MALIAAATPDARLVTASTGNHGIAVASAAARYGMRLTVLVPAAASPAKLERLRALESDDCVVEVFGRESGDVEMEARRRAQRGHCNLRRAVRRPGRDRRPGTVAVEVLEDWPECDAFVVPIGGGGLISGIGLWAKAMRPGMRLVGVQPSASPPMYMYFESGSTKPVPIAPTLADGVSGNIERDSITWKMCKQLVDEVVVVDEDQIADGHGLGAAGASPGHRGQRSAPHCRDAGSARGHGRTARHGGAHRPQRGRRHAQGRPGPMTLLSLRGIAKAFGGRHILRGVDLELADGARIGLVGPNGSGKSTLLRIAAGDDEADAGQITRQRGLRLAMLAQHPLGDERSPATTLRDARDDLREIDQGLAECDRRLADPSVYNDGARMEAVLAEQARLAGSIRAGRRSGVRG